MNDPWDVKSVRQGDQYQSCMKLNGVPLLPPVLSKECRKEMQYYKLLAKEVEKRISILKPYVEQDEDSSEDKTDAPELPECEHIEPEKPEEVEIEYDAIINKPSSGSEDISDNSDLFSPLNDEYHYKTSHIESSKLVIDLDIPVEEREKELYNTLPKTPLHTLETDELPERDCNNYKVQKELLTEFETGRKETMQKDRSDISRLDFSLPLDSEFIALHADGPSSLSTKSFTGSLHDLHSDSARDADVPKLIRQRSYTVLKPSPQLLAHLKVQSANTGIDVHSISMSESMSNVSMQNKKRRSWDLETAKVQWSSMALELKKSSVNGAPSSHSNKNITKKTPQMSPTTTSLKLQFQDRGRKPNVNPRAPKSDPIQRTKKKQSPVRHSISEKTAIKDNGKQTVSKTTVKSSPTKSSVSSKEDKLVKESTTTLISSSNDPASKVRELYEKLQQQQMLQMTSLIEKQKREQQLLQQVFEEQNNILLKQLKTVCPKSAIEAKQAWGDLDDPNRGPVSLSQLINNKPSELSDPQSPVSKTLTETSNYISRCDNVLKKSRDITNKIMTPPSKARTAAVANRNQKKTIETLSPQREVNRTRPGSPSFRNSSRRLNYETSASSDYEASGGGRENEQVSTARTNDTMADLNVTFPSDSSDECLSLMQANKAAAERSQRVISGRPNSPTRMKLNLHDTRPTNSAIKNLEETIHCSMNSICSRPPQRVGAICRTTTSEERVAASRIVACAKGFLVRRLMRTERVQGTVQTIRDALVCALQLHQDRAGIRGADVDLHRRLIQQITAACYSLHDTFIASSAAERCALIAADRSRRQALAARLPTPRSSNSRRTNSMDSDSVLKHSHMSLNSTPEPENFSGDKSRSRYMPSPRRQPWR